MKVLSWDFARGSRDIYAVEDQTISHIEHIQFLVRTLSNIRSYLTRANDIHGGTQECKTSQMSLQIANTAQIHGNVLSRRELPAEWQFQSSETST
jgi:hypothetical protein